jgi:L-lactate dehydrogenase complex protein LldE
MRVALFIPCFVDQFFPESAMNMVKILEKSGCNVSYNPNQTCCGQPAFNAGFWDEAHEVAVKFLEDFKQEEYIVAPSASCTGFIRNYYPKLFENRAHASGAQTIGKHVYEFTEFLTEILNLEDLGSVWNGKVTYHDSCAALRECKIKEGPRKLLKNVKGLELIEMESTDSCCGFGGTFSVKYGDISAAMADQKISHALNTGAQAILSTDLSCLMQLQGVIQKKGIPLQTLHIADVLSGGL